jgi:hypothetical protein
MTKRSSTMSTGTAPAPEASGGNVPVAGDSDQDGLRQSLDAIVALESRLEEGLARLSAQTRRYLEAPAVIAELHSLVTGQREALQAHLQTLSETDIPPVGPTIAAAFETPPTTQPGKEGQGTVAALSAIATEFTETAFGYAVLHNLAHRSFDVKTADLADRHRRNYLRTVQAIHQAAGDVAVQELQDAGHACRCQCPACGPGICICWHVHEDGTGLGVAAEGIVVRAPRAESNAERAGLRHGDVILAVDGHEVRSYEDIRARMGDHQPGESVQLRVRRGSGDPEELLVTR